MKIKSLLTLNLAIIKDNANPYDENLSVFSSYKIPKKYFFRTLLLYSVVNTEYFSYYNVYCIELKKLI